MGKVTGNPANFLGIHFFNPVQIMKLVEVVKTDDTSPEVFNAVTDFVKSIKKVSYCNPA
jgi:3-hydroxyacyl-CoA dehydrogenase